MIPGHWRLRMPLIFVPVPPLRDNAFLSIPNKAQACT